MNFHNSFLNKPLLFLAIPLMALFTITACSDDTSVDPAPPADEELNIVETAQEDGNFTILLQLAEDLGLAETLANDELTVFAPTDDAFSKLPDGILDELSNEQLTTILNYHLLDGTVTAGDISSQQDAETLQGELLLLQREGDSVTVNGFSSVISADITATNGVIHAVDEVLLPSEIRIALEQPNFIDVALASEGDFDILLGAIEQARLLTTLQFLGPFTGFAPSDEAFQEVDMESLDDEQLRDILLYHVTDVGVFTSDDFEPSQRVTMMNGDELLITAGDDGIFLNETAQVILRDNPATNGVIHVIDQVLMPESLGGGAPDEGEVSASITIDNQGTDAWVINEIDGEDADGELGTENTNLTLDENGRYTIENLGSSGHPFQLRDSDGVILITVAGDGELQDDEDANVVVEDDGRFITFTLSGELANRVTSYNCELHASMEGTLTVN